MCALVVENQSASYLRKLVRRATKNVSRSSKGVSRREPPPPRAPQKWLQRCARKLRARNPRRRRAAGRRRRRPGRAAGGRGCAVGGARALLEQAPLDGVGAICGRAGRANLVRARGREGVGMSARAARGGAAALAADLFWDQRIYFGTSGSLSGGAGWLSPGRPDTWARPRRKTFEPFAFGRRAASGARSRYGRGMRRGNVGGGGGGGGCV